MIFNTLSSMGLLEKSQKHLWKSFISEKEKLKSEMSGIRLLANAYFPPRRNKEEK
jgi:hypothetical protein